MIEVMKPKKLEILELTPSFIEDFWLEPKYDGYRTLIGKENHRMTALSRLGNSKTGNIPHILQDLEHIPNGTILDGEIIFTAKSYMGYPLLSDFTRVKQIMGSQPDAALTKQRMYGWVSYIVFDILFLGGVDLRNRPLGDRREILHSIVKEGPNVQLSPTFVPSDDLVEEFLQHGAEGVVLKKVESDYQSGKRPVNHWYKIKMQDTVDAVVMGVTAPELWHTKPDPACDAIHTTLACRKCGGRMTSFAEEGLIGAIIFGQFLNGILTPRGTASGMTMELRREISKNPKQYIGKVVEIQHMGLTPQALRHPQFKGFRDDKKPEDCTWD